jgi:hypothetical protein
MNRFHRDVCVAMVLVWASAVSLSAEEAETSKQSVWSTVELQLYGYIKLDAAYDTAAADPGNFIKWVDLEPGNEDDDEFNMTANQTRLGLWVRGPDKEGRSLATQGRVEIDFYGGGEENKPRPMLRLAYIDLNWRDSGWKFLAGQAPDVISPLVPVTVNYSVQWWAGNIGYRRPQIRLARDFAVSDDSSLQLAGAITRDIGTTDSVFANVDAGTDSGLPGFQGRLGWHSGAFDIGLSGHWAEEEYDLDDLGNAERFDSWSANLDLKVPLTEKVTVKAEAYTGVNLAQYLGGIGQGVNLERNEEIGDTGGWISLDLGPFGDITHHLGFTLTDPDDDVLEESDRTFNSSIFWNAFYSLTDHIQFALELSYWNTEYVVVESGPDSADDFRTQFAAIYSF